MIEEPNCSRRRCKHFRGVRSDKKEDEESQFAYCEAFPGGIPNEIAYGTNDHTKPFKGDRGILFEEAED